MTNNTPDYEDNLYFDSQNTKNDLCITSEQLTEQWKKGKIPQAWYYVKDIHNKESLDRYFKETDNFEYLEDWEVDEVLAPVPSYDEWKAAQEQINKEGVWYTEISHKKVLKENAQLKELLKECREEIGDEIDDCTDPKIELFAKIQEALK